MKKSLHGWDNEKSLHGQRFRNQSKMTMGMSFTIEVIQSPPYQFSDWLIEVIERSCKVRNVKPNLLWVDLWLTDKDQSR